eukprot:SAG11_NODE_1079_length_5962_cov_20.499232_2_plen_150_part_00
MKPNDMTCSLHALKYLVYRWQPTLCGRRRGCRCRHVAAVVQSDDIGYPTAVDISDIRAVENQLQSRTAAWAVLHEYGTCTLPRCIRKTPYEYPGVIRTLRNVPGSFAETHTKITDYGNAPVGTSVAGYLPWLLIVLIFKIYPAGTGAMD